MLAIVAGGQGVLASTRPELLDVPTTGEPSGLGVIKGIVRDGSGDPIADATVAIFRIGTSKLLKEVRSAADGRFLARIVPGHYTVLAVAEGFNPVTLPSIEVGRASELSYGFKLERAGSGNTLPEKRLDRNNPKWVIRAAQLSRGIYQNRDGAVEVALDVPETAEDRPDRAVETVVETYFGGNRAGFVSGLNVASRLPVSDNAEVVLAGQTGTGKLAPQRLEAQLNLRTSALHQLRMKTAYANIGSVVSGDRENGLAQFSAQALDEWKVREGLIVVFGVDYSRFVGAGDDFSISPRLGLQLDVDAKTRLRTSYATFTEERNWTRAIEFEDAQVIFRDPVVVQDIVVDAGKPVMNKSRRFEVGVERVLDNSSSIEANVFLDTTLSRGVGLQSIPFNALDPAGFTEITGNQQGGAQGLRLVYSRRLNGQLSAAAGYSVGVGQKLSGQGISNPANLFDNGVFQSFFGQFEADLRSGTSVKTIFRLSPQATVFAIDPFQGRLAIYDPSLSVLVTQNLPTLGLPFHAEAIVDARNLFGFATGIASDDGTLRISGQQRTLRGGILVRF